jgi:hypothetical protein
MGELGGWVHMRESGWVRSQDKKKVTKIAGARDRISLPERSLSFLLRAEK